MVGPGVVLGHRRLAILDLAARANQPLVSADQRYSIVFNGEIYNFRELRRSLEQQGVSFRTTSDTEVLLALYGREGADMLGRLRGMFALAIWDTTARELFLARDPYGIKPLYYAPTKEGLVFASQVKALVASQLVTGQPRTGRDCGVPSLGKRARAMDALSQRVGAAGWTLPARAGRCTRNAGLLARHPCALASERRRTPG